jgi:uncharacterized Zn-finger protein
MNQCDECGKGFSLSKKLSQHRRDVHETSEAKCETCGSVFSSKKLMQSHKKREHGENEAKCEQCDKTFKMGSITAHKKKHHNEEDIEERNYQCDNCDYFTDLKFNLKKHSDFHCGKKLQKERVNHLCNVCREGFKRLDHLRKHMLTHEKKDNKNKEVSSHCCTVCQKSFSRQDVLLKHLKVVHKVTEKDNTVSTPLGFAKFEVIHLNKKVEPEAKAANVNAAKIFQCDQCVYNTTYKHVLKKHIQKIHIEQTQMGRKRKPDTDLGRSSQFARQRLEPRPCQQMTKN